MKFPEKLWILVNQCMSDAICWGIDGKTIAIDYTKFENEYLGENCTIFKTKNIISFIRQLNLYGFRKCSRYMDVHEFKNPYFVQGRKDLLKLMRRKLGCALDVVSLDRKIEKYSKTSKEKDFVSNTVKESTKSISLPGSYDSTRYPFSPLQPLNSLPCGWWGNGYNPLNAAHPPINSLGNEGCSSLNIKREQSDVTEKKDANLPCGNLDIYRNIVFLPVPAQYGMYPGFYQNLPMPFVRPQQNEIENDENTEE